MNDKDQLCCITVIFMQPHTDYDIYINKFDSITEKLTLDYGEPKKEKVREGCMATVAPRVRP